MGIRVLIAVVGLVSLLTVYQNCSNFGKGTNGNDLSSLGIQGPNLNADYFWNMKAEPSGVTLSRLSQVQRWVDVTGESMVLFPPLLSQYVVNMDAAPMISQTSSGSLIQFNPEQSLFIQGADVLNLVSSKYSVALYIRNVQFPNDNSGVVRVFGMKPADGSTTGYIGLDIVNLGNGNAQIGGFEFHGSGLIAYSTVVVPISELSQGLSIAIRFSEDPVNLRISVNGVVGSVSSQGQVPLLGNVARIFALNGPDLTKGQFLLAGLAIWKSELPDQSIDTLSQSFGQYYENGGTVVVQPPTPPVPGTDVTFASISSHLNACLNCHAQTSSRSGLLAAMGSASTGHANTAWITPGDAENSLMIKSLKHESGVMPMPMSAGALSPTAIAAISNWIAQGAK